MTTSYLRREDWLAARRRIIGASDVAPALGFSPWKSPVALWAEKTGSLPEEDLLAENERVEWGLRLEGPIIQAFAERTGRACTQAMPYTVYMHPEIAYLGCTPDAWQTTPEWPDEGVLQVKTTHQLMEKHWETPDVIPLQYQIQVQAELAVTGKKWGTLAVLIGGQRLVWYDVERDDEFVESMLEGLAKFWWYVENNRMPPADGSELTSRVLQRLHPDDNGDIVELGLSPALLADTDADRQKVKQLEAEARALRESISTVDNAIKQAIGDATYGETADGSIYSWKTTARAGYTVEPTKFRQLRKLSERSAKKLSEES